MAETNPVHQNEDGKWYFWDETWAFEHGPYESYAECREEIRKYILEVLEG